MSLFIISVSSYDKLEKLTGKMCNILLVYCAGQFNAKLGLL